MASARIGATPQLPRMAFVLIAIIALGWGVNWPAMKVAVDEIPIWTFRVGCIVIAAPMLLAITWLRGQPVRLPPGSAPMIALIALFSVVGWQIFSAAGLIFIGSGKAAIIAFTMPLWATGLAVLFLGERLGRRQVIALALGMVALGLLLGEEIASVGESPIGGVLMLAAALSWAIGTILIKRVDWRGIPLTAFSGWQLVIGGVPVVIGALLFDPLPAIGSWSVAAWFGLLFAAVIGMVICVTAYFQLVTLVPASVAATGTLAVPIVGVLSSALLLGEAVGAAEVGALVLVVAGLALITRR